MGDSLSRSGGMVPFPDLEPSFSVSSALSPQSQAASPNVSALPGNSFHRQPRTKGQLAGTGPSLFGNENISPHRTPKTKVPLDNIIYASNPYPPSLQKYTDDLANRTQDQSPPTPAVSKSASFESIDAEFPLRLSFTEHSKRRF